MIRNDTIIAPATAPGMAAIAVIRISGENAFHLLQDRFFSRTGKPRIAQELKPNTVYFGILQDGPQVVDEVVVTCFRAPHSYTGEDTIEISCHGSVYIQQKILELFIRSGARYADPGEFTMRAFLHGKMDLSQAEAVADLISSETAAAHQLALNQLRGGYSHSISLLRARLVEFAALLELELDFSEEDVEFADRERFTALLIDIQQHMHALLEGFQSGNAIKKGIPIAIAGKPNAGKSTLLNALLNEERAIVSEIAGTTRDTIEDSLLLNGITFRLIDTAGIRPSEDVIEQIGISRAKSAVANAAVVLYVFDASETLAEHLDHELGALAIGEKTRVILVANKCDKASGTISVEMKDYELVKISAREGDGIDLLKTTLVKPYQHLLQKDVLVTNVRHAEAINSAIKAVERLQLAMKRNVSGDLLAFEVREAIALLGIITGEVHTEELLGHIFSKFCIGK